MSKERPMTAAEETEWRALVRGRGSLNFNKSVPRAIFATLDAARERIAELEVALAIVEATREGQEVRADAAEARERKLVEALGGLLRIYDRNTCQHDETHRGGAIWTICDQCGRKWADDEGGFEPHADPPEVEAARDLVAPAAPEMPADCHPQGE